MKTIELGHKTEKELNETLAHLRDNLRELRFNLVGGKVKNINEIHRTKRDIARILTLIKAQPAADHPKSEKSQHGK
jgi:ribosomal protein L29